jgi:glycosyltransferase involved in cell wall biosynthesis
MTITRQNIICFSTADWDTLLPTNKHQLMRRLAAAGNRVLYIETLGTRAPKLGSGVDLGRIGRRLKRGLQGPRKREPRLWTLSPLVRPRWETLSQIALNQFLFRRQVAGIRRRFAEPIAWVYSPYAVHLLETVRPARVVYHMVDDLSAVPGADVESLRDAELRLLSVADVVFCTEQSLYDRARRTARRAYFMPNVADYRHFSRVGEVGEQSATRLANLRAMPRPRVVFSGNLAPHKVDLDLIAQVAAREPGWQFVLVGPRWEGGEMPRSFRRLEQARNVHFTGHVAYEDLPAFLHEADVLTIPYVENEATRAVFPLKFFEYLATGRPVVASPLPSLAHFEGVARFAEGVEDWQRALREAMADAPEKARQRRALARRYTWERRLEEMSRALEEPER